MKATIYLKSDEDIINVAIEPFGKGEVHSIKVERTFKADGQKRVVRFFVDKQAEAWDFLTMVGGLYSTFIGANPKVLDHWQKNNLQEIFG